jgi:hypothetical protein
MRKNSVPSGCVANCLTYVIHKTYFLEITALLTLQMFTGHYEVSAGLWKRAVRNTEKPYTPQRERLCMLWGNPVIFTDCGEIL